MYENLTQEELEMVLEAGLEKVAYEEGVNEYIDSLEKVASVHDVDPEELHDFLEKAAAGDEEETKRQRVLRAIQENPGKVGALTGAGLGAGAAALTGSGERIRGGLGELYRSGKLPQGIDERVGGIVGGVDPRALQAAGIGAGALGGAGLGVGAAKAGQKVKDRKKEKTAAAYGLDEETFDMLFEAGVEALSE